MKPIINTILSLACGIAVVSAGDSELIPVPSKSAPKPVNSVDPVTGRPIVGSIPTYTVTITDPNNPNAPPYTVILGFSDQSSYDMLRRGDQSTLHLYASAARQNAMVANGRIVPLPGKTDAAPPAGTNPGVTPNTPKTPTPTDGTPKNPDGDRNNPRNDGNGSSPTPGNGTQNPSTPNPDQNNGNGSGQSGNPGSGRGQ